MDMVGLVPAAGWATRVQPLPCSKELYPVDRWKPTGAGGPRPRVACHILLDAMRRGGAGRAFVILREGKWDIPGYLRDGSLFSMHVAYLVAQLQFGVPYTLDQAYPFVRDALVLVGFPDLIFRPDSAFAGLVHRQSGSGADVVLGLLPARRQEAVDMVELEDGGRVHSIVVKPAVTDLELAWLIAVWTPAFTEYLHAFCERDEPLRAAEAARGDEPGEVSVSHVLQAALADGLSIEGVAFRDGEYVDLGDPEELLELRTRWSEGEGAATGVSVGRGGGS